jgi:hypothetical protein
LLLATGKWVCGLERVLHNRRKPIIYSLNYQTPLYSSFELDMLARLPGCHIYGMSPIFLASLLDLMSPGFDANATHAAPSKWPWGETDVVIDRKLKSRVHFNHFAVADRAARRYRSLQSVMRNFGHDWVDILKVNILLR